jgi:hypothetical protein
MIEILRAKLEYSKSFTIFGTYNDHNFHCNRLRRIILFF